ncbi:MAG: Crp/Fnr family transcriptional regulator [Bacteroidota bacterium]|nr:Crp/Fnr family transcriptional regulator [Bacteroidota bacterium]
MELTFTHRLAEKISEISVMPAVSLKLLCANSREQQLFKGQTLLKEGQVCRNIYFIESGQLRTYYLKNGKEINLNFTFENNFLTNLKSFLSGAPSEYYVRASEPTVVWKFNKDQVLSLYRQSCEIESFGRKLVEQLLIRQEDHNNLFKLYNPSERYHYVAKYHPKLLQRVSLTQLASYLGISRETISRIRRGAPSFLGV